MALTWGNAVDATRNMTMQFHETPAMVHHENGQLMLGELCLNKVEVSDNGILCVFTCVYVCVCVHVYVYVCIYIYIYIHKNVYVR